MEVGCSRNCGCRGGEGRLKVVVLVVVGCSGGGCRSGGCRNGGCR